MNDDALDLPECWFGLCREAAVYQVTAPALGSTLVCGLHVEVVLSWGLPEPIRDAEVTLVAAQQLTG